MKKGKSKIVKVEGFDMEHKGYICVAVWDSFYNDYLPLWVSVSLEKVLMVMMRPECFVFSILEGLISGIPLCCVLSFSLHVKSPLIESLPDNVYYVPCHKCLKKKRFRYIN
jgi:hypothetical protein